MSKAKKRRTAKERRATDNKTERYQIGKVPEHRVALGDSSSRLMISPQAATKVHERAIARLEEMLPDSKVVFVYGLQTNDNAVNIFTVAPALQSFANLVVEAHRTLHPEAPALEIKVRPFRKGSLLTDLVMTAPGWGPLLVYYGHEAAPYIRALLEKLGVLKGAAEGVLKVVELLKKPPQSIEKVANNTYRYNSDNNHIEVDGDVHNLMQNPTIHNHLYNAIVVPLEKGDISGVTLKQKGARRVVKLGKKQMAAIREFKKARELPKASTPIENEITVYLHPKRGAFDAEGNQWSFHRGKEIITANVKDEEFLERYRAGAFRLHHTDILKVRLVEHQKIKSGKVQTTYDVLEVIDYQPGDQQPRLRGA